ncbi:MAG: bifunctional adenosylcobinamide kinase/adenosylcobinamide-phosphate guanylyltransferase, partial [Verrucomicrobia bacterium]|nr:bifunctional adenosylcobinamide kinase/adenosylcobinamide-phosphate guanylyltransferase [Verrucomicrobiota bacterium]
MPNRLKANKSRVPKTAWRPLVRLLILGGARSGKSRLAQDIAVRRWQRPVYLATAEILDDEMADRVRMHRRARALKLSDPGYAGGFADSPSRSAMAERGARAHTSGRAQRWRCVEEPLEIAKIIRRGVPGTDGILVDCLTIWLSNVLLK